MTTLFFTIGLMALLMAIMAVGVMMGRPELKGSCGGVAGAGCACGASPGESCQSEHPPVSMAGTEGADCGARDAY